MNYQKIYNDLIQKRKLTPAKTIYQYSELHHIIPRTIDPTKIKDKNNLVSLSAREHFIAHLLLVKIYEKLNQLENYRKMLCAIGLMQNKNSKKKEYNGINFNSKLYEKIRIKSKKIISQYLKQRFANNTIKRHLGQKNGSYGTCWIYNKQTNENKKIKKNELEYYLNNGWTKGRKFDDEFKKKVSTEFKNTPKYFIYNEQTNENKRVKKDELNYYLNNGWIRGRKFFWVVKTKKRKA